MYISMYICVCVDMHICIHKYIHIYIYIYIYICIYIYINVYRYIYIYTWTYTVVQVWMRGNIGYFCRNTGLFSGIQGSFDAEESTLLGRYVRVEIFGSSAESKSS